MKKFLTLIIATILFGCAPIERGPVLTEDVTVIETIFNPGQHQSGVGIAGGDLVVLNGGTSDTYAVVFECQHGQFVIRDEAVWRQVQKGGHYRVSYYDLGGNRFEFVGVVR